jgi:hypothetical protein
MFVKVAVSILKEKKQRYHISGYFRYVDSILVIYDSSPTNIQSILHDFNNIHPNLKFTSESENNHNLITLRYNQMHQFYYLKFKTIYNISLWYTTNCL